MVSTPVMLRCLVRSALNPVYRFVAAVLSAGLQLINNVTSGSMSSAVIVVSIVLASTEPSVTVVSLITLVKVDSSVQTVEPVTLPFSRLVIAVANFINSHTRSRY
jgi:hypothetical protein